MNIDDLNDAMTVLANRPESDIAAMAALAIVSAHINRLSKENDKLRIENARLAFEMIDTADKSSE
jgi:hypothetical protein